VPKNSLLDLRSIRSNSFGKSETVALLPATGTLKPQPALLTAPEIAASPDRLPHPVGDGVTVELPTEQ